MIPDGLEKALQEREASIDWANTKAFVVLYEGGTRQIVYAKQPPNLPRKLSEAPKNRDGDAAPFALRWEVPIGNIIRGDAILSIAEVPYSELILLLDQEEDEGDGELESDPESEDGAS